MRRILVLALIAVASIGSAQIKQYVHPHVCERNGVVFGSPITVLGGDAPAVPFLSKKGYDYYRTVSMEFYPDGNDGLLQTIVNDMMDPTTMGTNWTITQVDGATSRKRDFKDALITEVQIPKLDQASKEANPLYCSAVTEGMSALYQGTQTQRPKQKKWLTSNFRLKLGDLPCSRVNKIDSFTVKQTFAEDAVGGVQRTTIMSDVSFEVPWEDAAPFMEWFQMERQGTGVALPFEFDLYDGDHYVIGVRAMLNAVSLGAADMFDAALLGPAGPTLKIKGSPFGKSKELTGHVTLIK